MILAVKVALNPNPTNQPVIKVPRVFMYLQFYLSDLHDLSAGISQIVFFVIPV